jgi:hypothetical protein
MIMMPLIRYSDRLCAKRSEPSLLLARPTFEEEESGKEKDVQVEVLGLVWYNIVYLMTV